MVNKKEAVSKAFFLLPGHKVTRQSKVEFQTLESSCQFFKPGLWGQHLVARKILPFIFMPPAPYNFLPVHRCKSGYDRRAYCLPELSMAKTY